MNIITIPYSFDNYSYLLICRESGEAAVVDPGEAYPVLREIDKQKVHLRQVFCTHHHADHISGLPDLLEEFSGLQVYSHFSDRERISGVTHVLDETDPVKVGKNEGRVLSTPGHTRGSICYHFEGAVFTGDTLFGGGCGRLFEGTPQEMFESLNSKLKGLPEETQLYFGHEYTAQNLKFANYVEPGNILLQKRILDAAALLKENKGTSPSSVSLELATNPFLRCSEKEIIQKLHQHDTEMFDDPLAVFTTLRALKDNY